MTIILLALDGEAIPLKSLKASPKMTIETKDKSGQSSSTTQSENGVKAKELNVSGLVDFKNKPLLSRIFALAEAKDSDGKGRRYRIANPAAQAINMRQGMFTGAVEATEQTDKLAWQVSFTLTEQLSTAEKAKGRKAANAPGSTTKTQSASGTAAGASENTAEQEKELTGFEKILKRVDDQLGAL
ncbi:baseplate complex protein [Serratia ficaria]|uniref:baseplate complex protein n=1 Tax=Serratia ficaria TaxID=61651 RepID=UPI0021788D22|nr:hypothetical protein [Serratia ficaria]CAI0759855.1 Uncharacterised protein [Serratia ficaria]CAI1569931.1 Uncharacterised protein [Serratia ficaria]CAI2405274.1 Uncharacterised protein [Serratia ficaria]CAI2431512.1 Uncharacterised protein [Serratia ficaria]